MPPSVEGSLLSRSGLLSCFVLFRSVIFGKPFIKRFALCYRLLCCLSILSCLSVCDVRVLWPNGRQASVSATLLDGDPAPPRRGHSPQFSAHVRCGQTSGWITMPLGMEEGLGPGDIVLDRDPAPSPQKGGTATPQSSAHVLWPNGWKDQDATWYGGRPRPRRLCVRWGLTSPPKKSTSQPFDHVYCGQRVGWIKMPLGTKV